MPKMNGFELDIEVLKLDINVGICFDVCKIINDQVLREFLSNYKCEMFYQKIVELEYLVERVPKKKERKNMLYLYNKIS